MSYDTSPKKLIYMANQIGKFFAPQGHDKAVAGVANHLTRFWDPSMRKKIVHHLDQGGEGLDPVVREAVERLRATLPNEAEVSG
jgi:formate dehydrogenase subunit delta